MPLAPVMSRRLTAKPQVSLGQQVEQRTHNPSVVGSSPTRPTQLSGASSGSAQAQRLEEGADGGLGGVRVLAGDEVPVDHHVGRPRGGRVVEDRTGVLQGGRQVPGQACYLVTPWNFPLAMITRKVGPALAAGCTVVLKPADLTPLTAVRFVELLRDAGVPDGVVNLVTTTRPAPVSSALLDDARLRKVSFTGSTAVGRLLLRAAAGRVLRCSMELGGNAPFVVLEGADLAAAVDGAMIAKFRNIGQACTAANRFLVHESLADEFGRRLAARASALRVGPGAEPGTDLGPLITEAALQRNLGVVEDAVDRGAVVLTGGRRVDRPGTYLEPTVLAGVRPGSRALTEEIFGPVAPVTSFGSAEEALAEANATEFGLASYVYARTVDEGQAFARGIEAGMVGVSTGLVSNAAAPFGGVKSSGLGREGGSEGIEEYLATRYVTGPNAGIAR